MENSPYKEIQMDVCHRFRAPYYDCGWNLKLGISRNVRTGLLPIRGVRTPPENGTSGWYIWAGEEMSQAEDFFVPLHTRHIPHWCKIVIPYLGLAPGWRFIVTPDYEDVWHKDNTEE
ncbi:hypothetical protein CFR75_14385 [Komagataeibacter xylinus]|uniref:Imm33-like domain-containing protein n=2 Tax=Komagataeibacter xylinus TaxID=28448 RepID=A0A318PI62_KOMXY|nr:hypothetical protein [Komagataeibacter xylinus]AZV38905.1 hypothetical protein CXP35_08985 [Komagataeibacter xylinus]PYD55825.1 hypothetical protein CFR75_14385 [Komagataeibacter xylinus]GBQ71318.1 hypothetical protein AA15237_1062 [Komagataeibacter xylinus NBRC 15237]